MRSSESGLSFLMIMAMASLKIKWNYICFLIQRHLLEIRHFFSEPVQIEIVVYVVLVNFCEKFVAF